MIPSFRGIGRSAQHHLELMKNYSQCRCKRKDGSPAHNPWDCGTGKHSVWLSPSHGGSIIHWTRNACVASALYGPHQPGRPDAEYLLLMDDDILPDPDYLLRLLAWKKDIVAGVCTTRTDPPRHTLLLWSDEQKNYYWPREWDRDSKALIEADAVGAAFTLVHRRVFERLAEAYLACHFEKQEDKRKYGSLAEVGAYWNRKSALRRKHWDKVREAKNWENLNGWWFQFLTDAYDEQLGEMGEDVGFCWKAKQLDFRIFADPQVQPGHIGEYAYGLRDYWDHIDRVQKEKTMVA